MATKAFLEKAYLAYFGRPVDPTGLTDFAASTDTQVADAFAASAESKALYGTTFDYAQINAIYLALFNREAEKAGLEYWYAKVADKTYTAAGAAIAILNGAQNADKTAIENKLAASAAFSAALDTSAEMIGYSGTAAAASARAFLSTVTTTAATAAAVDAAVASAVAARTAVAGQTFTLTTSIDNGASFTGGAGQEAFNATHLTFGASDVLVGGAGIDTLTIVDTGTAAYQPAAASVSGIENINIRNLNGSAAVAAVKETATVTFSALTEGQTLTLSGLTFTAGAAGATAAQVATAFSGGVAIASNAGGAVGSVLAGTLTTYGAAAGGAVNQAVFTQTAAGSPITDLAATGTATANAPQVSRIALTTAPGHVDATYTITVNGTSVTTIAAAAGANATGLAALTNDMAAKINGVLGRAAAVSDGISAITLTSATPVAIGGFTRGGTTNTTAFTNDPAPRSSTLTFATIPGATTAATFLFNGVSYSTATLAADDVVSYRDAVLTKLNSIVPGIATAVSTDAIAMNNGVTGFTFLKTNTNTTTTVTNAVSSLGVVTAAAPAISVVQGVAAAAAATLTDTVVATNFTDATTFTSDNSTGLVDFTGLTAAQTAVKKAGAGGLGAGFGATVTAGTVEINGGSTAGNVAITGTVFTTATINSTGSANTIGTFTGAATTTTATTINATTNLTLTGAATNLGATVTVNGAGNVNLGVSTTSAGVVTTNALESGVTTLNAAGLTGSLTVALGTAVTQKVTGGSGNDTIYTGAVLTTGSVDAGAGSADVLVLTSATHLASPTLAAKYTNFEALRINTGITQDMGNAPASITSVQLMGVATVSNMTPAQAAAVSMRTNATAGTADALNLQLASQSGTNDTLTIVAGVGTTTTGALDIAALNVTGFEVLNLQANPGPSSTAGAGGAGDRTTNITGTITGATLKTINLTGTAVSISDVAVSGATAGVTINGSALTGDGLAAASQAGLTVAGSAFAGSTITGSGVRDVFTIGAEGSAYNGGAGNDRMTTTVAILVADGVTDGTMVGGDGTDTLVVSDTTTTLTDNHFVKLSGFEALTLSNTVGDASITTGGSFNTAFATGATIVTGKLAVTKDVAFLGGLATVPITLTIDADLITGAATDVFTIVTGSAADNVTFTGDATYVGVNGGNDQGTINISTAAGDDTISYTHGQLLGNTRLGVTSAAHQAVIVTGGTGADSITKGTGSLNSTTVSSVTYFNMAAGDSGTTLATQDKITGFSLAGVALNTLSDVLNFEGTATVSSFSNSIDFGTILTHSITGGIVTFDTASTFASAKLVTASNLADVIGYLNANMGVNETVGFLFDSNGDGANDATMVFHQGSSLTTVADDLVQLVGTTGLSLNATLTTATAGAIAIA